MISENAVFDNGNSTGDSGIECGQGCNVRENTIRQSFGFGLTLSFESGYADNVFSNNTAESIVGGFNLGGNLCDPGLCP